MFLEILYHDHKYFIRFNINYHFIAVRIISEYFNRLSISIKFL